MTQMSHWLVFYKASIEKARVRSSEIEDVILGAAVNKVKDIILEVNTVSSGLPVHVPGMSVDRQCASGLMAITIGAKQIACKEMDITL